MRPLKWLKNNEQLSYDVSLALLVFFVPTSPAFPNILMIPAGILFISIMIKKNSLNVPTFWVLLFLYALSILIQALIANEMVTEIGYSIHLIVGLFIFMLVKESKRQIWIIYAFLFGLFIAIFGTILKITYQLLSEEELVLSIGEAVNKLLIMERPYFAFSTVLANYMILSNIKAGRFRLKFYWLALFFTAFCFFIAAKLGMILHILIISYHVYRKYRKLKPKYIISFIVFVGLIATALANNQILKERLRISESWQETKRKFIDYEPRFIIWPCSYESLHEAGIAGFHSHGTLKRNLVECYAEKIEKKGKRDYYLKEEFNTHNQYFDALLTGGIISFLLFIAAFIWPFISKHKYDQMLGVFLLFMAFFMVENVFLRQTGCFLFGIFAALGYNYDRQKN